MVLPTYPTIGEIARRCGVPTHRVDYIIATRGIKPVAMAGHSRIFTEADVEHIASELRRIDEERGGIQ